MRKCLLAGVAIAGIAGLGERASAVLINFDDQGLTGPSTYGEACTAVSCPQTVVVSTSAGNVTFSGGVILTNTVALPADVTSVYGSAFFGTGLINPITISFANPVSNIVLDVLNGLTDNIDYTVSDNAGHSATLNVAPNLSSGATAIGFPSTGGTLVDVASVTIPVTAFDFFIDNVQFNVPVSCGPTGCTVEAPEPDGTALIVTGLFGLAFFVRGWRPQSR